MHLTWTNADGETLVLNNAQDGAIFFASVFGLASPLADLLQQRAPGQDGITGVSAEMRGRDIRLELLVTGASRSAFETNRQTVARLFSPRASGGGLNRGTLQFVLELASYQISCLAEGAEPAGRRSGPLSLELIANLIAEDPFFQISEKSQDLIFGTGTSFPFSFPITFSGGAIIVNNEGDVPVAPVLEIEGNYVNVSIQNMSTAKVVKVNTTIPGGQRLEIDHRFGSSSVKFINLVDGSESDQFDKLDASSTFWNLQVGENRLLILADSGSGNARIRWSERFQSI